MGPDLLKESMQTAMKALLKIRDLNMEPAYLKIVQGRNEPFSEFLDRIASAISKVHNMPDFMRGALLRQCALQNCNDTTKQILVQLPADASVAEMLECMSCVPVGHQALLVDAVRSLGDKVLAALTPLQKSGQNLNQKGKSPRCFHCGRSGHIKKECSVAVWCPLCQLDNHCPATCLRQKQGQETTQ